MDYETWQATDPDGGFAERRGALLAEHGRPALVRDTAAALARVEGADPALTPAEVVAYRYPSRAVAEAWHQLNADHYGHEPVGMYPAEPNSEEVIGVLRLRIPTVRATPSASS